MICYGIEARSRSRRRTTRRSTSHIIEENDQVVGADIPPDIDQSLPHPGRVHEDPPLTVYTEYRFLTLPPLPGHSPTSPISSRDNVEIYSPPPLEATSRILRSQSLPPKKRRRRHHRSGRNSLIAPITFTPTVTLQEAPRYDDSSSSSAARPMASSDRPPIRAPPAHLPPKVDPIPRSSKQRTDNPSLPTSHKTPTSQTHQSSSTPIIRGDTITASASSKPGPKPEVTTVSDSEYTYVYPSSSDDSDTTEDKSIDKTPVQSQIHHPLQLTKAEIPKLKSLNTLEIQARVLMSKACDNSISPSQFHRYLLDNNFHIFNTKELEPSKQYRTLCIFGPPNIGKSSAAQGMNAFIQGVQVTTTSKKFYKYVNETSNVNMYHFTNDSFSSKTGIARDRLTQSVNSISLGVGYHFIIVEGHRLFECDDLLNNADYVVILTALPSTLRRYDVENNQLQTHPCSSILKESNLIFQLFKPLKAF